MAKLSNKIRIVTDEGQMVEAFHPVIVSASRSTDIPAFYLDWFFERLKSGYSVWVNPFNGVPSYVSYADTRFVVFWSKNPRGLFSRLDKLEAKHIGCYVQYTLNDYEAEGLERGVPPLDYRIDTFRMLVERLGVGGVVWRFDPMVLTNVIGVDDLLEKVKRIGDRLQGLTEKMVFSFADISTYRKVAANLRRSGVNYLEWDEGLMREFASRLSQLNRDRGWNYRLATCSEKVDLQGYGIEHNRCIDDELIIRRAYKDTTLMRYLGVEIHRQGESLFDDDVQPAGAISLPGGMYAVRSAVRKDSGQRSLCGCIDSKDIGQYNTCPHLCEYCYANSSKDLAIANYHRHCQESHKDSIL